jgi:hypothetical protein
MAIYRLCVPETLSRPLTWCLARDEGRSGSPGVLVGVIEREPEEEGCRQLEVKNSGSAQGTKVVRGPARLEQAPGTGVIEHLDRAQFMQRVQPPDLKMSGIGDRQRPLERLPRRVEIIDALTSPNQLKRVTTDIRASIARGQHALGQAASSIDVVAGERHLCLKDRRAGSECRLRVCRKQPLRSVKMHAGRRPSRRSRSGVSQLQVDLGARSRHGTTLTELGDEAITDCHCFIDPSRQRQRLDKPRLGSGAPVTIVEQPDGTAERVDSGGQPPSLE